MCQKLRTDDAVGTSEGLTRTLSLELAWLAESHECVGDFDRTVLHAQSVAPLRAWCVQPALSNPVPSNVSVKLVDPKIGVPLAVTVFESSTGTAESKARTT